jgi:hypothetical protein
VVIGISLSKAAKAELAKVVESVTTIRGTKTNVSYGYTATTGS